MRVAVSLKAVTAFALAAVLLILPCLPVAAEAEQEAGPDYVVLVSESTTEAEEVYYYLDGEKRSPADFTWSDKGHHKQAVRFEDETQYIRLATAKAKEFGEFTFSGWFYWFGNRPVTDPNKELPAQQIFHFSKNEHHYITLSPHATDGEAGLNGIELRIENGKDEPISLHHEVTDTVVSAYPTEEWHHIALSVADDLIVLYIDGAEYARQEMEDFSAAELNKLVIGSATAGQTFFGLVDDVILYPGALDATGVLLMMQNEDPKDGATPTTKAEILATRPKVTEPTVAGEQDARILGLSPTWFAVIGVVIVLIIAAVIVISLRFKNNRNWPEEDHP